MRLDKFLKVSRLVKRRSVADAICSAGRVQVNHRPAKSATKLKVGDLVDIRFGSSQLQISVRDLRETVRKEEASGLYEVISSERIDAPSEDRQRYDD
ncbi:MAG: RNA-binding S4 domain-containing protein [Eubacteriales bacterium]|nr:RNA-binding S4 domain-containing protein [Eubacteriales bacterium]